MIHLYKIVLFLSLCSFWVHASEKENMHPEIATQALKKDMAITKGSEYMVVAAHPLAVQAGEKILSKGGSAVDAAIAVQMVLNVVEPQSSGIGGGGFMMHFDKEKDILISYDGRETAPSTITSHHFLTSQGKAMPFFHAAGGAGAVGVPGLLKMLHKAHQKHGILPWESLFQSAISIARDGFPLSERLHKMLAHTMEQNHAPGDIARYLDKDKKLKSIGEIIKNLPLAKTFEQIAHKGITEFYQGNIANNIIQALKKKENNYFPSSMTLKDMRHYNALKRHVPCLTYHAYKLCGMGPPSSGGITVMQALKLLEPFHLEQFKAYGSHAVHLMINALRLAFADRNRYIADPDFTSVPVKRLLNETYLEKRRHYIHSENVLPIISHGDASLSNIRLASIKSYEAPSTTHISIIDKKGNAVSMTNSIEKAFGTGIVTKDGFLLNNQLTDFDFIPEKNGVKILNAPQGGKRPRSSMAPFFVFDKQGDLKMIIGSPGGARIISYVMTKLIALLDWKMPLDKALKMPHITVTSTQPNVELETHDLSGPLKKELSQKGYFVLTGEQPSGIHVIMVDGKNIYGAADPRREGIALGK